MCGIAGAIGSGATALSGKRESVLGSIAYRGQDDSGVWEGNDATLFHTRLSILDISGGHQPMTCVEGRFIIVFNGEIYNYLELRQLYAVSGASFRTHSDTETILEGFRLKGPDVLHDLNGMFAFAIWDTQERKLFLARDRLGKKPLYWTQTNGLFVFSSTIATFANMPEWDNQLDAAGLALYGALGGFPDHVTAFSKVRSVPAAHWMNVTPDSVGSPERYWRLDYTDKTRDSFERCADEYEELLTDSLRLRLRSDVPVAMSFSGGVDSGTLAALARHRCGIELNCYTIDYEAPGDASEEAAVARCVSQKLTIPHEFINYDYRSELLPGLEATYPLFDQPCQQLALVYSSRLYEVMKSRCTVVISGNGADELFTGYSGDEALFESDRARRQAAFVPGFLRRFAPEGTRRRWSDASLGGMNLAEWWRINASQTVRAFSSDQRVLDRCDEIIAAMAAEMTKCGVDTLLDFKMHIGLSVAAADTNYRLPDITGYAAQVEVRSPFMDYRMAEFAARLPPHFKVGRHNGRLFAKYLPRRVYERYVGADVAWGKKRGMGANLLWNRSIAEDVSYEAWFAEAFNALEAHGIDSRPFRTALDRYRAAYTTGGGGAAGVMMNGVMLGHWLRLAPLVSLPGLNRAC